MFTMPLHKIYILLESTGLFQVWGLDFVGPINPNSSKGHKFILTTVEYFSKWAEAAPMRKQTGECVAQFVKENISCRFGLPHRIITKNGAQIGRAHV